MLSSNPRRREIGYFFAGCLGALALLVLVDNNQFLTTNYVPTAEVIVGQAQRPQPNVRRSVEQTASLTSDLADESRGKDPETKRIALFEKAAASVVNVNTFTERMSPFSLNAMDVPMGTGSGFVWDDDGHIITNHHVIYGEDSEPEEAEEGSTVHSKDSIQIVILVNGQRKEYKAAIIGSDPSNDIAVVKIDAPADDLHPIKRGISSSSDLKVGQDALAIGNPFGLDHTLTAGVVSGLDRETTSPNGHPISNCIQTDAAVNPGNSGGPLLTSRGQLMGMNAQIYSPSGAFAGVGFAVPVDTIEEVVPLLIRDGKIVRPTMGLSLLDSMKGSLLGVEEGVMVMGVKVDGPADKAGIVGLSRNVFGQVRLGDVIVKMGNSHIEKERDLYKELYEHKPGDTVEVTVVRSDSTAEDGHVTKVLNLTLAEGTR